jgi:hypothetical protein
MKKQLTNMTEQELEDALISNAQRQRPHSLEELDLIQNWAHRVLVEFSMLDMTIRGNVGIQVLDGDVKFIPLKPPRGWKPTPPSTGKSRGIKTDPET